MKEGGVGGVGGVELEKCEKNQMNSYIHIFFTFPFKAYPAVMPLECLTMHNALSAFP